MPESNGSAVRDEVRQWLTENWDPERPLLEWRGLLADSGWGCPTWPSEWYGRGLEAADAAVVDEELARIEAVGPPTGTGMGLAAPTILRHGPDDLKRRFLRGIAVGEDHWCQLFSEPGNGSDLAGLTTRAELRGDEYLVNGQKVWNTGAYTADYAILVARTDWDVPKHRGITYFVISMRQPGVEVRPLRQMNFHASFNEVFLTDATVPVDNVVGDVNNGWAAAITTLMHERNGAGRLGQPAQGSVPETEPEGLTRREAAAEAAETAKTYVWYPQRAGRVDLLASRAAETGTRSDPVVRQAVVDVIARQKMALWSAERARVAQARGLHPGPEGSLSKLRSSDLARRAARAHTAIAGASGTVSGADAPLDGTITEILISVPAHSIAGGTDEIQHNIIGERVLGLPKEPQFDRDIPFREVRTNPSTK